MVKFKLKLGGASATTPSADSPGAPAADSPAPSAAPRPAFAKPGMPRVKIKQPKRGIQVKVKQSAVPSTKVTLRRGFQAGYGYDSEASDREEDPLIETCLIMRWKPGPEADFVRQKIEAKDRMDFLSVKFKDSRHAAVTLHHDGKRKLFAAKLVDLPTVTEVHKTFDKKNIFKVADLCQMLLVGDRISHEDTVLALPTSQRDLQYPHGLTPPLRYVRKRRFRKRASAKTIEMVEREVDRLLALDSRAEMTRYEIMDRDQSARDATASPRTNFDMSDDASMRDADDDRDENGGDDDDDDDDEGEDDYDSYAADLEAQLNSPMPAVSPYTPGAMTPGLVVSNDAASPAIAGETPRHVSSGSEVGSDDDDDDDANDGGAQGAGGDGAAGGGGGGGGGNGEGTTEQQKKRGEKALKEGVSSLQEVIATKKAEIDRTINPIMKQRLLLTLRKFENELDMKLAEMEAANS